MTGRDFRKIRKLMMCFGFLLIMAVVSLAAVDMAEAKSYEIKNVIFDVQLNEDGSATIWEDWKIEFRGGTYSRYYKDVHTKISEVEKFSDLTMEEVTVDGQSCELTTDVDGRPEYHYSLTQSDDDITMAAYFRFNSGDHNIRFVYTLSDVVKDWGGETAVFCYRYLGDAFEDNVGQVQINVYAPENCKQANWDPRFIDSLSITENKDSYISLEGSNRSGMIKVKLWMDPSCYTNLTYVDPDTADKEPLTFWSVIGRIFGIGFVILAVAGIVAFIRSSRKKKRWIREYEADSRIFQERIHQYPEQIPLGEMVYIESGIANQHLIYTVLLDLLRRRVLTARSRKTDTASAECPEFDLYVNTTYGLEAYENALLSLLAGEADPRIIRDEQLNQFLLMDAEEKKKSMDEILEMIKDSSKMHLGMLTASRSVKEKEIREELKYIHTIVNHRSKNQRFSDVYDIVYMALNDFSDMMDPTILTEMILRYGWTIGNGMKEGYKLESAKMNSEEQIRRSIEEFASRNGLDSYLLTSNSYYYTNDGDGIYHGDNFAHHNTLSRFDVEHISHYFSSTVSQLESQIASITSSSSSGSSCSSCSSCSGCGGGGAD